MEIMLRCSLPDQPGRLARLAGAIGGASGDIQAIEVVEARGGTALDDLYLETGDQGLTGVVQAIERLPEVELVHTGPSRGQPGDAVTRLALGLSALLSGAMTVDHAVQALVGGLLHASSADLVDAPPEGLDPSLSLALPFGERTLIVHREYPFTDSERARARTVLDTCGDAASAGGGGEAG